MQEDDNLSNAAQAAEGEQAADENQSDETTEDEQESEGSETETGDEGDESSDGETDETEAEGDEDGGDEGEPKPKKPNRSDRYKARIARLEAENRRLVESGPRGGLTDDAVAARVEEIIGKKPDQKDFGDDYIGFERAMNAYEVDRRQTTREVKKQGETQAAAQADRRRDLAEDHQERVAEFRKKVPDFEKVMKSASDLKASPTVEDLVLESDKSAHVIYYLAKNPGELDKLNAMTEREAARAIGRIESRLSLPSPKKQTLAPKPVKPLKGGAAPHSNDAALDAWMKKTYG